MNYWRMSMRWGSDGEDFFPQCRERRIAAMGYYDDDGDPIVGDCRKLTVDEFDAIWREKGPRRTVARNALRSLAYEVKPGDILYSRSSPNIVARGRVTHGYAYDPRILQGTGCTWEHFVRVDWIDLPKFRASTQPTQPALLKLEGENLESVVEAEREAVRELVQADLELWKLEDTYTEGGMATHLVSHHERNDELRAAAVRIHGTRCQVCGFSFSKVYGALGESFIEVHHLKPIADYEGEVDVNPTTDMAVVCSNCHRMLHRIRDEPLSIEELREIVEDHR